jgi:hypothetical protein
MDQRFGKDFLASGRLQELLKWTAIIDAVGQCVTLAVWLGPPRPADQRFTFFALAAMTFGAIYMLSGFVLWSTMFWFTVKYWPINLLTKIVLGIIEIITFGWIVPLLVYLFAYRSHVKSLGRNNSASQLG